MRLTAEMYNQIVASLKSDSHGGKDKRREPRVGLVGEADLVTVGDNGRRLAGKVRVRDVSATGIGLTFTQPLNKNQRFVLQLDSQRDEPVWLVCLTAYCRAGAGSYTIGARIKQLMRADEIAKVEAQTAAAVQATPPKPLPVPTTTRSEQADIDRISKAILG